MPRTVKKKIYKAKRKEIDGSKDQFVIRFKALDKQEIKALRLALDECCADFMDQPDESEA